MTRAPWRDTLTTVGPSGERGPGGAGTRVELGQGRGFETTRAGEKHLGREGPGGVAVSGPPHQSSLYIVHVPWLASKHQTRICQTGFAHKSTCLVYLER